MAHCNAMEIQHDVPAEANPWQFASRSCFAYIYSIVVVVRPSYGCALLFIIVSRGTFVLAYFSMSLNLNLRLLRFGPATFRFSLAH